MKDHEGYMKDKMKDQCLCDKENEPYEARFPE